MSTYRREWECCGDVTETEAWEPSECPICAEARLRQELAEAVRLLACIQLGEDCLFIDRPSNTSVRADEYDWITERNAFLAKHKETK